jgi:acyl-CoA thioester hydrolase
VSGSAAPGGSWFAATGSEPTADGWFRWHVAVRFRDIDAMGHAHHSLPLIYLEEARAAFWAALKGDDDIAAIDYVIAEVTLRFHARITYPGEVMVALCLTAVGSKSYRTDFEIRDNAGQLLSSGSAVQVAYDYATGRSRSLGEAERCALERWHAAYEKNSAMVAETMPMNAPST